MVVVKYSIHKSHEVIFISGLFLNVCCNEMNLDKACSRLFGSLALTVQKGKGATQWLDSSLENPLSIILINSLSSMDKANLLSSGVV